MKNINLSFNKVAIAAFILTIFCAFPYTRILPINSITQPYPLIVGFVILLIFYRRIFTTDTLVASLGLFFLLFFSLVAYVISLFQSFDFGSLKWLLSYISPLLFFLVYNFLLKNNYNSVKVALTFGIIIWFIVGCIQKYIEPSFLTFLTSERHSEASMVLAGTGRGVFGLAHEPTHHAFHLILMMASILLIQDSRVLPFLVIIATLFFAMSSSALLCFIIAALLFFFNSKFSSNFFILLLFLVISSVIVMLLVPAETRIKELILIAIEDPSLLLAGDYSLNMRIGGLYAAIDTTISNYFLPAGISHNTWINKLNYYYKVFPWIFEISEEGWPSGYFIILYQLGLLSLPLFVLVYRAYFFSFKLNTKTTFFVVSALNVFIFQFFLTSPFFGIILAALLKKKREMNSKTK